MRNLSNPIWAVLTRVLSVVTASLAVGTLLLLPPAHLPGVRTDLVAAPAWASESAFSPTSAAFEHEPPRVEVISSTDQEIVLQVNIPPLLETEVWHSGTAYQRLALPGTGTTTDIGKPEVPTFARFVAIPRGAEVEVEVLADTVDARAPYMLYPAQEPLLDQDGEPEFAIHLASYQRDEYYPNEIVELEGPYVIRGVEVVLVRFYPLQYNAVLSELKVHTGYRARLSFVRGAEGFVDERLRSPYFDSLLSSLLLNYAQLASPPRPLFGAGLGSANGCDFLIITPPHLESQANLLADWKIRRGIDTEVRTTAQTGSTASAIRSYIQNAYDTWGTPPSFVLFLGDAEYIPTNYVTLHPDQPPGNTLIGTDLYYATVDGSDYFPDISTGRISVDTASEAAHIINRIINYERNPTHQAGFYSSVAMAAYFEDDVSPYTYEDGLWVRTSEQLATYLGNMGFDEQRIYYAHPWVTPLHYHDGTPLPFYLLRANGFPWSGSGAEVVDAVNSGRLILNHRDHGVRWMWAQPELYVWDVEGLNNGDKLPVVFSINCETGWFDNETDDTAHGTSVNEVNFAEAWQRNPNGGAAGVVASTRASYGGYNDELNKGLYDAIWPDFLPYTPVPGPFSDPQYRMGQVLNYGKLYMATMWGESVHRKITFEVFHYFGDPTMEIWTAVPQTLTVSQAPVVLTNAPSFTVQVAQDGALVSLVKDGEILATATSSAGSATINFSSPLTSGPISVTVTKHNYTPYEVMVTAMETIIPSHLPLALSGY